MSPEAFARAVSESAGGEAALDAAKYIQTVPENFTRAFVAAQASGGILLLIVIITVLCSRKLVRTVTWMSMLVCWVISALSYILLSFFGKQTGAQPSFHLCVFQATLTYGAPSLCAFATLSFTMQVWFDVTPAFDVFWYPHRTLILVCMPYVVYIGTMIEAMTIALQNRDQVVRGAYCVVRNGIPGFATCVLVMIAAIAGVVFQVLIGRVIVRSHRAAGPRRSSRPSCSMLIRMGLASFAILSTIAISAVMVQTQAFSQVSNGFIGALPLITFLIFGTNRDILLTWIFWRNKSGTSLLPISDTTSSKKLNAAV